MVTCGRAEHVSRYASKEIWEEHQARKKAEEDRQRQRDEENRAQVSELAKVDDEDDGGGIDDL